MNLNTLLICINIIFEEKFGRIRNVLLKEPGYIDHIDHIEI